MAELVDAQDSKSCDRKVMRVRFSLPAPSKKPHECEGFLDVSWMQSIFTRLRITGLVRHRHCIHCLNLLLSHLNERLKRRKLSR